MDARRSAARSARLAGGFDAATFEAFEAATLAKRRFPPGFAGILLLVGALLMFLI
jgi:hypothetical protein